MRSLLYRDQAIDLFCKSMDWFPYDWDLHYEKVKQRPDFLSQDPYKLLRWRDLQQ